MDLFYQESQQYLVQFQILKKYINHPKINIILLEKNKKAGFCRNFAIRNSKSDYIAFIDSDDL